MKFMLSNSGLIAISLKVDQSNTLTPCIFNSKDEDHIIIVQGVPRKSEKQVK